MCGIAGIWLRDPERPAERSRLRAMLQSMAHRGPDGEGYHLDGPLGLAHNRLAIIDLENGAQPLSNEDGTVWITYNGEVYNYPELRRELEGRGHRFSTNTDTEVIVHLYEDEGARCVERLNGMFAFAIWDSRKRSLLLARDRFGIKPLYYAVSDEGLVFASEIKALLRAGVRAELNPTGLRQYLSLQFCLGEVTLFEGIKRLLPARTAVFRAPDRPHIRRYWEVEFDQDFGRTQAQWREELLFLLRDSVRIRLRSDVPLGAYLSGGIDSSGVLCLATELLGRPMTAFSAGFKESPEYDEGHYARLVAGHAGCSLEWVYPRPEELPELFDRLVYLMDEPAAGPALFPQHAVSGLAARRVKVILGGQGADEIFFGYARYLIAYLTDCLARAVAGEGGALRELDLLGPGLPQLGGYGQLMMQSWSGGFEADIAARWFSLVQRGGGEEFLSRDIFRNIRGYSVLEAFREEFASYPAPTALEQIALFDLNTLLPALLHVEDRMSMGASIETRVPYLDHRLVELQARIPLAGKFPKGEMKAMLKRSLKGIVPAEVLARRDKMGFPVPLVEWLKGPLSGWLQELDRADRGGLVAPCALTRSAALDRQYGRSTWGLLCLKSWSEQFLGKRSATANVRAPAA